MRSTDIAIVGGGLAGSTTAATLGRADISAILIGPHPIYLPDFRVEKLRGHTELERFRKAGLAESMLRSAAKTDRAIGLPARQAAQPAIRHPIRQADQRDSGSNSR
jgi:2-polyprenyl-6-methoxyphenol hydroxylase-like FAD-dependent oxidoreductase